MNTAISHEHAAYVESRLALTASFASRIISMGKQQEILYFNWLTHHGEFLSQKGSCPNGQVIGDQH